MAPHFAARLYALSIALVQLCRAADTVFASYAFVRTGERTPFIDDDEIIPTLTPFGAEQMQSLGTTVGAKGTYASSQG